jgi:hypothetical protein
MHFLPATFGIFLDHLAGGHRDYAVQISRASNGQAGVAPYAHYSDPAQKTNSSDASAANRRGDRMGRCLLHCMSRLLAHLCRLARGTKVVNYLRYRGRAGRTAATAVFDRRSCLVADQMAGLSTGPAICISSLLSFLQPIRCYIT